MVVTLQSNGCGTAYVAHNLNTRPRLADAETMPAQYGLVALCVQFSKTMTELKLFTINHNRAVRALLTLDSIGRQAGCIDAQEIAHPGLLQLQEPSHTVMAHHMYHTPLYGAENPL